MNDPTVRARRVHLHLESLESRETPAVVGALDPSFGSAGKVITNLGGASDLAAATALQPDGKILVVGTTSANGNNDFAVARYNPDGSLDTSFDGDGKAIVAFDFGLAKNDGARAVAVQPDGKIVVAGFVEQLAPGDFDFGVVRFNPDGSLDVSFDADGKRIIPFDIGGARNDQATSVVIQGDGKIVVAGFAQTTATNFDFAFARLSANGTTDTTFDSDGRQSVAFDFGGNGNDRANGVALQADGRIVAAGFVERSTPGDYDFGFVRLNTNGSLDTAFDGDGRKVVVFDLGSSNEDKANAVAIQPDGKIVAAGSVARSAAGDFDFGLVRLDSNGAFDTTFSGDGKTQIAFDFGGANQDRPTGVAIDTAGRIVAGGFAETATSFDFAVTRLTADGLVDVSFNSTGPLTGRQTVDFGGLESATGLALSPSGRIVLAGSTNNKDFAVARLVGTVQKGQRLAVGGEIDQIPLFHLTAPSLNPIPRASVFTPDFATGQYSFTSTTPVSVFPDYPQFVANVRPAVADVNGDGVDDTIMVTGPGTPIRFAVVSGVDNSTVLIPATAPFGGSEDFTGGGFVSAADFNNDGRAEMIFTPDLGGGPRITIFSLPLGGTPTVLANFFGIDDPNFRGGARTGAGDVNNDGVADLAVSAGFQGGPRIALFNGKTLTTTPTRLVNDFFAFEDTLRNGAYVTIGDLDGDGFGDLFFGAGPGGAPRMLAISGQALLATGPVASIATPLANFFVAGNTSDRGGVRVEAVDADGDNKADLAVGSGEGSPANVRVYLGRNFLPSGAEPTVFQDLGVFNGVELTDGVFVG